MFEPDEQEPSTGEPGNEGSILQKYFSQLGISGRNGMGQARDSPPGYPLDGLRSPRYYGAPPNHTSTDESDLNLQNRVKQIQDLERIQYLLRSPEQPTESSRTLPTEPGLPNVFARISPSGWNKKAITQTILPGSSDSANHRLFATNQPEDSIGGRILPARGSNLGFANSTESSLLPQTAGATQRPTTKTNATRPSNQTATQPATLWMMDPAGNLTQVPAAKYESRLKTNYQLAVPLYLKNGVGLYVTPDEFQQFMSKNYEGGADLYQPGLRAVVQDSNGKIVREIIVPAKNAEKEAQRQGAKLLPMTEDERKAYFQANRFRAEYNEANQEKNSPAMQSLAQRSGGLTKIDPAPKWQPDEYDKDRLMVPGAVNPQQKKDNVKTYLPYVIDGLRWKFGENEWQQYLPYTLATINAETSTFEPVTQGNRKSQSITLGRGFIQLSADEYKIINKELNEAAKNDEEKVDLVHHPEQANDPKIAGRILAQFLYDRLNGYHGNDEKGRTAHRDGLNDLIYRERDSKVKPEDNPLNLAKAMSLYTEWLQKQSKSSLTNLQNNPWVRARAIVNGHHDNNLPNGLERFLPALIFAERHQKIVNAAQDPNATMTLQEAANAWTGGLDIYGDKDYASSLRKRLGIAPGTNLSAIKLSDLPPRMLNQMLNVEREYALNLEEALTRARNQ